MYTNNTPTTKRERERERDERNETCPNKSSDAEEIPSRSLQMHAPSIHLGNRNKNKRKNEEMKKKKKKKKRTEEYKK